MCAYAHDSESELKARGVKDSKVLSPEVRERLADELRKEGAFELSAISAVEITERMRGKTSLNELEALHASALLHKLSKRVALERVVVDSPDPVPSKFETRIRKYFDHDFPIACLNHADRDHPIVGAASIIAKSEREKELEKIKALIRRTGIKAELGSGYSHDAVTIAFLERYSGEGFLQEFIRHEWSTAKRFNTGGGLNDFL
ncbi:hypothetical protein AUJ14_03890 [Candidatus Micrarchaeota archaeon CG1_02_55_22]|nr:MAG: hypothetical protein AUJ14_03890 [Candidatus Micrarchaeota archaeon CG1_02_55_22]